MITKQELDGYEITGLNEQNRIIVLRYASFAFYGSAIYVALLVINVIISSFYGFNLTLNYISDLGSKNVIPFPYFNDLTCVLGGLISLSTDFYARKKLRIRYKESKHSILFLELGVVSGVVGNISYILLGVFSLDRAGPGQIYHGITTFFSFGGYIISIFFFSLNIVLSHRCKLKNLGVFGLVVPIFLVILYCFISIPLMEWFLLSSIVLFMLFLAYYVFKV